MFGSYLKKVVEDNLIDIVISKKFNWEFPNISELFIKNKNYENIYRNLKRAKINKL